MVLHIYPKRWCPNCYDFSLDDGPCTTCKVPNVVAYSPEFQSADELVKIVNEHKQDIWRLKKEMDSLNKKLEFVLDEIYKSSEGLYDDNIINELK